MRVLWGHGRILQMIRAGLSDDSRKNGDDLRTKLVVFEVYIVLSTQLGLSITAVLRPSLN